MADEKEHTGTTRVLSVTDHPLAALRRGVQLRVTEPSRPPCVHRSSAASLRVGSRPGNDVVVEDESVSRFHVEIGTDAHGFRLRDLGSTNGTFVDGIRVVDVYLRAGARIRIGQTEIVFEPSDADVEVALSPSDRFGGLVGKSATMRTLFARLERAAPTDYTVLVEGESGTGKELVAEALHAASRRASGPYVVLDCASVPQNLVESELFGHERGAFTGATAARAGCLQEADGGTLFLDEIGELPLELQPKLLRVLEKREFRRVGGKGMVRVDVRVVAATNRDLAREVNAGSFRDDLYHRLAVVRLEIPPLRDRLGDVRPLVEHFVRDALAEEPSRADAVLERITEENWRRLEAHPWRGNVRELRNVIHRALALSGTDEPTNIQPSGAGPPSSRAAQAAPGEAPPIEWERPFLEQRNDLMARFERDYVLGMLERHGGKIGPAAQAAGLDRSHFKRLLARARR